MRKVLYAILPSLFITPCLFGQSGDAEHTSSKVAEPVDDASLLERKEGHRYNYGFQGTGASRAPCHGDTILHEDFANDTNGNNAQNVSWSTAGSQYGAWKTCSGGTCTSSGTPQLGPIESTTASNGFVYCDIQGEVPSNGQPHEFLTSSAIDMSGYDEPVISIETLFAHCCILGHEIHMEVSTDSSNWEQFDLTDFYPVNLLTPNPAKMTFMLNDVVSGNASQVYIRFTWPDIANSQGTQAVNYVWYLDDIVIREGHRNDVGIGPKTAAIPAGSEFYSSPNAPQFPYNFGFPSQFPSDYTMLPRCTEDSMMLGVSEICNNGRNSLNNVKVGYEVIEESSSSLVHSDSVNIGTLGPQECYGGEPLGYRPPHPDTAWSPTHFPLEQTGEYLTLYETWTDTADCDTANNVGSPQQALKRFHVTPRTYALDEFDISGGDPEDRETLFTARNDQGNVVATDWYNVFDFSFFDPADDTIKQVCFFVSDSAEEGAGPIEVGISNFDDGKLAKRGQYFVESPDIGSWVCRDITVDASTNQPINGLPVPQTNGATSAYVSLSSSSSLNFAISGSGRNHTARGEVLSWFYQDGNDNPFLTSAKTMLRVKLNSKNSNCVGNGEDFLSVEDHGDGMDFALEQNRPNPFTEKSTIRYQLQDAEQVRFSVRDVTGKVVNEESYGRQSRGEHRIDLDAADFDAGIYYYTLQVGGERSTKKMIITE